MSNASLTRTVAILAVCAAIPAVGPTARAQPQGQRAASTQGNTRASMEEEGYGEASVDDDDDEEEEEGTILDLRAEAAEKQRQRRERAEARRKHGRAKVTIFVSAGTAAAVLSAVALMGASETREGYADPAIDRTQRSLALALGALSGTFLILAWTQSMRNNAEQTNAPADDEQSARRVRPLPSVAISRHGVFGDLTWQF